MGEGISYRDFGRQLNVSAQAVSKAVATGKIPRDCIGETILKSGRPRPCIIDPERAAKHWGRNRDPSQVREKAVMSAGAKKAWAQRRGDDPPDDEDEFESTTPAAAGAPLAGTSLVDIKRVTETYKAKTAKLEFEERSGKLVNADQVKIGFVNMVTAAKTRLMSVPSKAKTRIPTLTIHDIEALEDLIADALQEIAVDG